LKEANLREVVIVSAVRTPIANFGGSLRDIPAPRLGAVVVKEALDRAGIEPESVDEVYMGNVIQAGLGQCPARQASIYAGLPEEVPAVTINRVCASGLTAVNLAAQSIATGNADTIIAGGMENMSQGPYALPKARWGYKLWDAELVDLTVRDGLWEIFNDYHMGITAENIARKYNISREKQDKFALLSHKKSVQAIKENNFENEIVHLEVPDKKNGPITFGHDERPRSDTSLEKLSKLPPVFREDGTVTAGNSSGINDGAAALVLMGEERAKKSGKKIMAKIKCFASAGVDPAYMGLGPIPATQKALRKAKLTLKDIDMIEGNEAFAAQSIAVMEGLDIDPEKMNLNGGAIALGHPIGCTGARILVTLVHLMERKDTHLGLATLCVGGGQGVTTILDR
jgi:acetyl-CoA C-acetyltransferase